jgi:hypothetical protein
MKIILTKQCESLTGSVGRGFGYHIQKRKNGFFAKRNSKGIVPPDGHWRFIVACAEQAQMKLHIADIRVSRKELAKALAAAGFPVPRAIALPTSRCPVSGTSAAGSPVPRCPVSASSASEFLSATDVLTLKRKWSL